MKKRVISKIEDYPQGFQEFYKLYPRRRFSGLKRTFKQWKARMNNGFNQEEIVDAARIYMGYCKKRDVMDDYIKLSYVFLGENFGDELDLENWKSYEKQGKHFAEPSEWRRKLFYVIKKEIKDEKHAKILREISDWYFLPKEIKKLVCSVNVPEKIDHIKNRINALPVNWKSKLLKKFPDAGEAIGKACYEAFTNGLYLYVLEEAELNCQENLDSSINDIN